MVFVHGGAIALRATWAETQRRLAAGELPELRVLLSQARHDEPQQEEEEGDEYALAEGGANSSRKVDAMQSAAEVRALSMPMEEEEGGGEDDAGLVTLTAALSRFNAVLRSMCDRRIDLHLIRRINRRLLGEADDGTDEKVSDLHLHRPPLEHASAAAIADSAPYASPPLAMSG